MAILSIKRIDISKAMMSPNREPHWTSIVKRIVRVSLKNEIRKPTQNEKEQHSIILAVNGIWPIEKIVRSNLARLDFRPNLQAQCLDRTFFYK